jgi:uncharacterized protein (TIGR02246 family)
MSFFYYFPDKSTDSFAVQIHYMKQTLLPILLLIPFILTAQKPAADDAGIHSTVNAMISSWNNHQYDDMKTYATEDCDWVNVKGMWWKGRKEVIYAHNIYHQTIFRDVVLTKKDVHIRYITKEVAIVHLLWHTGAFITPSGNKAPEEDDMATLVLVKRDGKWLLTATENVSIVEAAQKSNPVLKMPK